ncbi:rodlin [Streptomyces sp. MST-110588]|uniref:rodlin n=1 Tax=Streptomyces sp. MST-110588 TaxID=2833628 RepID=UPI001F5DBE2C|nr:rodlin [Streptomyces sp. MST-110588]UNO41630.1 RdlA protein [Streptomyces sp. MST-110588]
MIKKFLATTAVAASIVGTSAAVAPQAMAFGYGHDIGPQTANANNAGEGFANSGTEGHQSPQLSLIESTLNKPCIGLPDDLNINSIVSLIPIAVQDIEILETEQHQTCTENSTQAKEDDLVSHIVQDIPILGENGSGNS